MTDRYIHGTDPAEQGRLAGLNRATNAAFVRFLQVPARATVLEVGSGLGLLSADVASAAADVRVFALERSAEQLSAAIPAPSVTNVRGDANRLPFADQRFDLVYARYVLEHVVAPERVVAEMRRVARRGARVAVCENDVSLLRFDPSCPAFEAVWQAFQDYQERLGADGRVGRRLYRLFKGAGLSNIELSVQPEVHWHGSPGFEWWVQNIIGNVESVREGLIASGLSSCAHIDGAVNELSELAVRDDASSVFVWNRAVGVR